MSTCHWCHVMNRESFNDEQVAKILNRYFVPIKVDREERPDIDKVYMEFSQALTGSGGWPLNVLATPEGKPFSTITYLPKNTKGRMIGIIDYAQKINNLWENEGESVLRESDLILEEVKRLSDKYTSGEISEDINKVGKEDLIKIYDRINGGFGTRPKFPMPQYILFLLGYGTYHEDRESLDMAENVLEKMYKGGIFDHIGYGFFRYSVDEKWLVPHFEKMLYDNALMSLVYTKAYEITGRSLYGEIAKKIFEFTIRDLRSPEGGFYSALDADSEGIEGKYYLFSREEIMDLLGDDWGEKFCTNYDISNMGNFEGLNIPNLIDQDLQDIDSSMDSMIDMISTYREMRIKPHRDEKILTSWNGLMIGSLAYCGKLFKDDFYINKAREAADFILEKSVDDEGNLLSICIDGESYNLGYLDDYSFFIYGLLQLWEALEDEYYLRKATELMEKMLEEFWDGEHGGFYFYGHNAEELILRPRDYYDGAIPSGNAFALLDILKLYRFTKEPKYRELTGKLIFSFGGDINKNPLGHLYSVIALNNMI
ncbi:MAG: thioredoxin domain-containing protein [Tissierellaceae bacterium]